MNLEEGNKSILEGFTGVRLPSNTEGKARLVMLMIDTLDVAWSRIKGWSSNCPAVGRADGSRCRHSLMKLLASLER